MIFFKKSVISAFQKNFSRSDEIGNMTNARLVLKIPKRDYTQWKFFGISSETEQV